VTRPQSFRWRWKQCILEPNPLTWRGRLVGLVLAEHMDTNGRCYPSLAVISKKAGCSISTVKVGLAELRKHHLRVASGRTGRANTYQAVIPSGWFEESGT
jgi:hypothetical protein